MIESLFGDLAPPSLGGAGRPLPPGQGSATLETMLYSSDVVVDHAPADTIRQHFAAERADLRAASPMLTLIDPSQLWAAPVLQALSQAAAQPLQRLNLRDRHTLRTLAVIERTLVPRHGTGPLRVYHAAPPASGVGGISRFGAAADDVGHTLAEGSQLTAVIVNALQPQALTLLLHGLLAASHRASWRCPALVFLVPPGAEALQPRLLNQPWPTGLQVQVVAEPLGSASGVWNSVLAAWERSQRPSGPPAGAMVEPVRQPPRLQPRVSDVEPARRSAPPQPAAASAELPSASALARLLTPIARTDGLLACAVVDLHRGDVLAATDHRETDAPPLATVAQALCAARQAHALADASAGAVDEVLITAGARQMLLRSLPGQPTLGVLALVARSQANLALLRFKLLDAEKLLAQA